ncbi:MAG: DNA topoisomerase III [Candidatus Metalachnospira sp.]|nr:DNA topoisomerase III [Candidatus Metalachnospira sp.]
MGKILVIAEKPSVARDIAKVLSCNERGDGYLCGENYIVSWAVGHLVTLCEPEDYDKGLKKWSVKGLPIIPREMKLKAIRGSKKQLDILKKLMNDKDTESLICATDSGREGELIFRYIYNFNKCKKPYMRLWISSMTDQAIRDGFEALKPSSDYDLLYSSAKCRSEADWLVGINATRAFTLKYNALLSIGRVQTPTLAMIVKRQKEIDKFQVGVYYEVSADYGDFKGTWTDDKNNTRIDKKEDAEAIAEKVRGKNAIVTEVSKTAKQTQPPQLYDLTELQRDCNKMYSFSAQKTLDIAQSLYEKRKMITYPRTDSRYLSTDMEPKIKIIMRRLINSGIFAEYAQNVADMEKLPISKRIIDNTKVTDHHAIIPADNSYRKDSLTADEKKVFGLIAIRFIAVFNPPYKYTSTKITMACENETFVSKGTTVTDEGWKKLYRVVYKNSRDNEDILPEVKKEDVRIIKNADAVKKETKPPLLYNEATLLTAMENAGKNTDDEALKEKLKEYGLGTPATRAAIIERLIAVGYIHRKGKNLVPDDKGIQLIEIVPEEIKSPVTTGKWEKGLGSIAKGSMQSEKFMTSINRYVYYLVGYAEQNTAAVAFPEEKGKKAKTKALGKCPVCGEGNIFENSRGFFCGNWKKGCKFTIWKDSLERYGVILDDKLMKELLKNGKVEKISVTKAQTGEKCTADIILNKEKSMVELMNMTVIEEVLR